ncbi:MAG: hypothetical protein GWO81_07490 [Verrucomicrobia bacterium]|nr:hypothetical protein [Verrucomicrobiota bacterium]
MSGMDLKLDSATSFSLEGGMYFEENFSFGFEWTTFNSVAKARKNFADFGALQTGIGDEWNLGVGLNAFEEEIDLNRFMFVFNYEYFFNDQFSLLINTGLGVLDVEQEIKVYEATSPRVDRINS